jgi:hypothetical protein
MMEKIIIQMITKEGREDGILETLSTFIHLHKPVCGCKESLVAWKGKGRHNKQYTESRQNPEILTFGTYSNIECEAK